MKKIKLIHSFTCLIFILILAGCVSIKVINKTPKNAPKGFVEFYYLKSEGNIRLIFPIYSIVKGESVFEGRTSGLDIFGDKVGLRLSKSPGAYTFSVHVGEAIKTFPVLIKEGMVTPVRIVFTDISKSSSRGQRSTVYMRTVSFNMSVYPGEPIPIAEYGKK